MNKASKNVINNFDYKSDTKFADGISEFVMWYIDFYKE